jgi:Mannosyl-glycoprotein endo-beta-N-acetylglucosaminidase
VSRATAVAYDVPAVASPPSQDNWPGRGNSGSYRLLGDDNSDLFGPPPTPQLHLAGDLDWDSAEEHGYLGQPVDMPYAYFASQPEARPRPWFMSSRLLVGLVVALVLAIGLMLVTPVLASGRFGGAGKGLSLSSYSDLMAGTTSSVDASAVIDVSTGQQEPQPEAQQAVNVPAPPPAQPGEYSLVAAPSTSVAKIEEVLRRYGSPAAGQGQLLYDLGVKYGIDPAFALAFFVHESGCGTQGVARFTNSLGNIRWTAGFENYQGYRKYSSWQEGIEDWYKLITDLYINGWGLKTVDAIIPVYAPAADSNNPSTYIASVKASVDSWRGK